MRSTIGCSIACSLIERSVMDDSRNVQSLTPILVQRERVSTDQMRAREFG